MMVLDTISDATSYQRALPPCRVGNMLHSISYWFKTDLRWLVSAYSSLSIYMGMFLAIHSQKHKGGWYTECKVTILLSN